jgi:hypothetical protein
MQTMTRTVKVNFTTHVMFGILVAALFSGDPEIMLLVGIGSAIPDLDREYGFLSKESFRHRAIHRALCHNFLFLGVVYLINPYLALGTFLHTLLDALTSARDRGVEWLYPFSRLVNRAAYDYSGNRMELDPKQKIYFLQYEVPALTEKTTEDLKPGGQPQPWRRTYGPALSGGLLDQSIFFGSLALTLLLIFFSALGFQKFIDLSTPNLSISFTLPLLLGASGIITNFVVGEIDRKKLLEKHTKRDSTYKVTFFFSIAMMIFAIILGAIMNPQVAISTISKMQYIAAGIALALFVSIVMLKIYSSKPLPREGDDKKEPSII